MMDVSALSEGRVYIIIIDVFVTWLWTVLSLSETPPLIFYGSMCLHCVHIYNNYNNILFYSISVIGVVCTSLRMHCMALTNNYNDS